MWRRRSGSDFNAEIESHLQLEADRLRQTGLSDEEARAAARRAFGNVTMVQERFQESQNMVWWEQLLQDLRSATRLLTRSAGFSAIVVMTIALGVGATTAIYSVIDATLLHPPSYTHPEQLVRLEDDLTGAGSSDIGMSTPEWHDLERTGIFASLAPSDYVNGNLTGSDQPQRVGLFIVAPSYFAVLGVTPQIGRTFDPRDPSRGFNQEVVISNGLWKRAFASDPNILGRTLRLDNDVYHVIGVMPPGFRDPGRSIRERNVDGWAAAGFAAAPFSDPPVRSGRDLTGAIGRLSPGLTVSVAQRRLDAFAAAEQRQFPREYPAKSGWRVRAIPLQESVVGDVRQSLLLLLGAVVLVLLIACVNIANLLLARASARRGEMAIRQALGASGARLSRQSLAESLFLSLLGGLLGVGLLLGSHRYLVHLVPASLPSLNEITINWGVLCFALAASIVAAIIFGLAPALNIGRLETRGAKISRQQARTRRVLVITEFALSLVLMIGGCLLLRSFWDLLNVPLGYDPRRIVAVQTWLPQPNDPSTDIYGSAAQVAPFLREVLRRGATLPGVQEVAIGDASSIPLGHDRNDVNQSRISFEGRKIGAEPEPLVGSPIVTPNYFHLLSLPLKRGRLLSEHDNEGAPPVAVVNEAFVRAYLSSDDAIGKRMRVFPFTPDSVWTTVVGVVGDARTESLAERSAPMMYLSAYQQPVHSLVVFVRGPVDIAATGVAVRQQVQAVNPALPVFGVQTLTNVVAESLAERRFSMEIVALFALTALVLAALGIYGVISYIVSERTHEIGIRLALGAQRANIMRMVLRQGLALAITGTVIGLAGALVLSGLMSGLLFGVSPTDPVTFAGVAVVLTAVAVVACYVPARRATAVNPTIAQRS
jgi:predicted permease